MKKLFFRLAFILGLSLIINGCAQRDQKTQPLSVKELNSIIQSDLYDGERTRGWFTLELLKGDTTLCVVDSEYVIITAAEEDTFLLSGGVMAQSGLWKIGWDFEFRLSNKRLEICSVFMVSAQDSVYFEEVDTMFRVFEGVELEGVKIKRIPSLQNVGRLYFEVTEEVTGGKNGESIIMETMVPLTLSHGKVRVGWWYNIHGVPLFLEDTVALKEQDTVSSLQGEHFLLWQKKENALLLVPLGQETIKGRGMRILLLWEKYGLPAIYELTLLRINDPHISKQGEKQLVLNFQSPHEFYNHYSYPVEVGIRDIDIRIEEDKYWIEFSSCWDPVVSQQLMGLLTVLPWDERHLRLWYGFKGDVEAIILF